MTLPERPCWLKTVPTVPGRYFWRDTESRGYGVCLVAWSHGYVLHGRVTLSELKPLSFSSWGYLTEEISFRGETGDSPGWSFSSREDASNLEFWSEVLVCPVGFPELNGEPDPPPESEIEASRAEYVSRQAKQTKADRKAAVDEKKAVKAAKAAGITLFRCNGCDKTWKADELVPTKKRVCGNCDEEFFEGDDGRSCPSCNRPFTRLEEEFPES